MSIEEIKLPDVGGDAVEVIEICVNVGDFIEEEEAIIVVETEKASMDIPASFSGTIESLNVKAGDKITEGTVVCTMKKAGAEEAPAVETKEEVKEVEAPVEKQEVKEETVEVEKTASQELVTQIEDVFVPDLGQDGEVDVIEIIVSVGDEVNEEDGLITLETEKATMDVPAPFNGKVKELLVNAGDKVKSGALIAKIEKQVAVETKVAPTIKAQTPAPSLKVEEQVEEKVEPKVVEVSNEEFSASSKVYASPSVRRIAREFGVDLAKVKGSGRKNRILKEDVRLFIKEQLSKPATTQASNGTSLGFNLPELKPIDFSKFGEIETVELSRIQKISGPSLHRNWVGIPHVTQFDEADITELEEFRKAQNAVFAKKNSDVKISPLVFALKAVAKALQIHPNFNSSLSADGQSIVYKKYINIAVAVDTPNGLVVPVIKNVDKKGFGELSTELKEISIKARDGKLKLEDMQGACFTISSLGGIGGTKFTPIINAPEVAILGLSKSEIKPKWDGEKFEPRLMLPLSLSYDHRVIDGADGARFTTTLATLLSDIRLLLL
ncbi:dihydrolipoyllysine-residue acetyltransferase [Malaciobacter mytili]|uniref:dihydrolipoyllysine-residue acetyltransferase n=1 Tax=Malaciobacter mytili TaxID=603050 RepID=UPI003BB071BB